MKISVLSYDLSHNCLGRAYILTKMLSERYDVEIVGPMLGNGIWSPVKNDTSIKYKVLPRRASLIRILNEIDGDIIYAIKPKMSSFGYGLIKKFITKKPLILDIDDWELGFFLDNNLLVKVKSLLSLLDINNFFYTFLLEFFTKHSNEITVSSSFLQKKFGGTIIPHARDTNLFDPVKYNRTKLRKYYSLPNDKKVILFSGTPGKHKGIDSIIKALDLLNDKNIIFLIVGADLHNEGYQIPQRSYVKTFERQPFEKIPEFLSVADLVVLPQKGFYSAKAQIPAKIFDAMAMEKPIIASRVSDLPQILRGCGIIVEQANINLLAEKIKFIFDNPEIARNLGRRARKKCIRKYSFQAVKSQLFNLFDRY